MANKTTYRVEVIPTKQIEQQSEICRDAAERWINDGIPRGEASCFCCSYQWKPRQSPPPLAFIFIKKIGASDDEMFVSAICSSCYGSPDRDALLKAACRRFGGAREAPGPDGGSKKG
jgi:hypothetical protein